MYVAEWIAWLGCLKSDTWLKKNLEEHGSSPIPIVQPAYEDSVIEDRARQAAKRFACAKSQGPIYTCNDTYLEMRCGGLEDKRGLISLVTLIFVYFAVGVWIDTAGRIMWAVISGSGIVYSREIYIGDLFFFVLLTGMMGGRYGCTSSTHFASRALKCSHHGTF